MKTETLQKVLRDGISRGAHSIFFFPGLPPLGNKKGIERLGSSILKIEDIEDILRITLTEWQRDELERQTMEQALNELLAMKMVAWEDAYTIGNMAEYLRK